MSDEINSDWIETQVEMMKAVQGYEKKEPRKRVGNVDYVKKDGKKKKLLRVIYKSSRNRSKAVTSTIDDMIDSMKGEGYKEATIIAKKFTIGAIRMIRGKENLDYISMEEKPPYSLQEILYAIQTKTIELCESFCGKAPSNEDECSGYNKGKYSCIVRRISDDSDFHSKMGWKMLLYDDFSKLTELKGKQTRKGR